MIASFFFLKIPATVRAVAQHVGSWDGTAAYTLLVGASPSVVLTAVIGGLALFARQLGHRQGLPSHETQEAVKGYTLLRTDRNGWI